jgi:hypothetical protein
MFNIGRKITIKRTRKKCLVAGKMFMRVEEVAEEARLKAASLMTSWGFLYC